MSRTLARSTTMRWAKTRASPLGCGQNRAFHRRTPRPYSRYALRRPPCHPQFWLATRTRVIMLGTLSRPAWSSDSSIPFALRCHHSNSDQACFSAYGRCPRAAQNRCMNPVEHGSETGAAAFPTKRTQTAAQLARVPRLNRISGSPSPNEDRRRVHC